MMDKRSSWRKRLTAGKAAGSEKKSQGSQGEGTSSVDLASLTPSGPASSQKSQSSLCKVCAALFKINYPFNGKEPWRTPEYTHHSTMKSLATSAEFGCQICLKLWDTLNASHKDTLGNDSEHSAISKYFITDERTRAFSGDMYELHLYVSPQQTSETTVEFILQPSFEVNHCISRREIPAKVEIGPSMAIANEWMHQCRTGHVHCNKSLLDCSAYWLPTRLLDVSSTDTVRVVMTDNSEVYKPYMTLSHVWGTNLKFKLKRDNLEELQKGFPTSLLPRTLADAVLVCKYFGVDYIWIDNLCILQDTPEDFEREADSMDKIYGNADCNISATACIDGTHGLFTERPVRSLDVNEVSISWRNRAKDQYVILDRSIWTEGVAHAPANRRAWIVQERLLARRVLHFGSRQLFWECHELEACETWPNQLPTMVHGIDNGFKAYDVKTKALSIQATDDFPGYRDWNKVVSTYTRSRLSFPRDKLVALAGISSRMNTQRIVEGDYLAGLWRAYLPSELLWRIRTPGTYSVRADPYRAPSWSWASVDVEVTRHLPRRNDMTSLCSVIETQVKPLTDNMFGQVVFGLIRMRAKLFTSHKLRCKKYIHEADETSTLAMDIDPALMEPEDLKFCLVDESHLLSRDNPAWRGLVLKPAGSMERTYQRVGYFHIAKSRLHEFFGETNRRDFTFTII